MVVALLSNSFFANYLIFNYRYPWGKVKLLLAQKLENVIEEYITENPDESVPLLPNVENVSFADMKQRLLTNIGKFNE